MPTVSKRAVSASARHTASPVRPRRKGPAKTVTRTGPEVVGRIIDVSWPSDNVNYKAFVLSYNERRRQHKVIYIEDETIELLQLGSGPGMREWHPVRPDEDVLLGEQIELHDNDPSSDEAWFDFMRTNKDDSEAPFVVFVFANVDDPDPDEITGPRKLGHSNTSFYRVIHLPNDFLTTIDLSCVEYSLVSAVPRKQAVTVDAARTEADAEGPIELDGDGDGVGDDQDTTPSRSRRSKAQQKPSKSVNVIPDDASLLETLDEEVLHVQNLDDDAEDDGGKKQSNKAALAASRGNIGRGKAALVDDDGDGDDGNDEDDVILPVKSRRRGARAGQTKRPVTVAADIDIDEDQVRPKLRKKETNSAVEIKDVKLDEEDESDVPIRIAGQKRKADVMTGATVKEVATDDAAHDTASDEEKLGWVPNMKSGGRGADGEEKDGHSQVGDYVLLDTGDGGARRQAFVEAYLPEHDRHFVAFIDSRAGNMQIKLTEKNHTVLPDDEVERLTRLQGLQQSQSRSGGVSVDVDVELTANEVVQIDEDAGTAVVNVGNERRKTRGRGRPGRPAKDGRRTRAQKTVNEGKSKRRYSGTAKVLGKSAGAEIVSRCVSVVWPGTKLVYVALVMGYSPETREHMLLYMVDHCVETLELRFREWELLPRGKEPWMATGMVGKRLYVWWSGEYTIKETQELATKLFGEDTKVAYEAYVLSYVGEGRYKILYPCTEDCEERNLQSYQEELEPTQKEWDLLEDGIDTVCGLPVIGWEG